LYIFDFIDKQVIVCENTSDTTSWSVLIMPSCRPAGMLTLKVHRNIPPTAFSFLFNRPIFQEITVRLGRPKENLCVLVDCYSNSSSSSRSLYVCTSLILLTNKWLCFSHSVWLLFR